MIKDAMDEAVLRLRIVVAALALGVASFGAIAFLLVRSSGFATDSSLQTPLVGALGALTIGLFMAYPIIEKSFTKSRAEAGSEAVHYLPRYSILVVIRSAMIESIGLFGGIIYLMTSHVVGLVAMAVSICLLLGRLPSRQEAEAFVAKIGEVP